MKHFIFSHGFGFNSLFWENLASYFLKEQCSYQKLSDIDNLSMEKIKNNDVQLIGIGHSLGFVKLLSMNHCFDYLIGCNSFVNFLGYDLHLRSQREKELAFLKKQFAQNPLKTLTNFYQRCGVASFIHKIDSKEINVDELLNDLELLHLTATLPKKTPTLILGAQNDRIVPPILLKDNFWNKPNVIVKNYSNGSHALGLLQSTEIYNAIMSFTNATP